MKYNLSTKGAVFAALPPLIVLVLFYSLAVHMYLSLGQWPHSIGYRDFSPALILHGKFQFWCVMLVVAMSIYLWPVAAIASAAIPRARRLLPYLAIFALAVLACYGFMQLAPEPFLTWWRD